MTSSRRHPTRRRRPRVLWTAAVATAIAAGGIGLAVNASASPLLTADFENGAGGWSKSGGDWSVVSDGSRVILQGKATSENAREFAGSSGWKDYTLRARVKPLSLPHTGSAVAVLARSTGATSYDRLVLGSGRARLEAVRSGAVTVLASTPITVSPGTWYTVRLQESGRTVSAWVNDRLVGSGTGQATKGRIGLQTMYASAEFDDIAVDNGVVPVPTTTTPAPPATTTAPPATTTAPSATTTTTAPRPTTTTPPPSTSTSTPATPAGPSGVSGYATVGGSTTGGAGGTTVTVTSASALASAAGQSGAAIIRVDGNFSCSGDIAVTSNKSVIGVGSNSGLTGCGLSMKSVSNVIVQNLKISKVQAGSGSGDAIHLEKSHHIWIDHNDLSSDQNSGKDYYDGLVDITHASDYVTVSWNYLHDHYKATLVGHSDSNGAEDTGKMHVTYHHNYFNNINSRTPSLRFGTGHVYDNYFVNGSTGVHSRMGAQMLVQNNVFRNVKTPIQTDADSSAAGYVNESGNDFGTGTPAITQTGSFTKAPYGYTLDPTSSVISAVTAGAGTGRIG